MKPSLSQPFLTFKSIIYLPSPSSISYLWNTGSLLGLCLFIQIISGLFLAMHYSCDTMLAFESIAHIMREVNFGWVLRVMHANVASLFFIMLYTHVARGLYFKSFFFHKTWLSGVMLLLLTMGTAFLGYVLPWGQMSFWGATVITSLASAVPMVGSEIVGWLWGGFSVANATLTRFFTFHFILPFILSAFAVTHIIFLHSTGSSNPLGVNSNLDKTYFTPFFTMKDFLGVLTLMIVILTIITWFPWHLGDPDNFSPANSLVTPHHIQPEWYFLFAYAILRSIPNKLGGVLGLILSILILFTAPFISLSSFKSSSFSPFKKILFWSFVWVVILLSWIGARPVEEPYIFLGQLLTTMYFSFFFMLL